LTISFLQDTFYLEVAEMPRNIEAVYENGVLKPLSPLDLKEHERVRLTVEEERNSVRATSGMLSGISDSVIEEVALSPEFLPEEA
jgi:predicted DNA-binding antitoxin AbrB/MazE fold protein